MEYIYQDLYEYACGACGKPITSSLPNAELKCYHCGALNIYFNGQLAETRKDTKKEKVNGIKTPRGYGKNLQTSKPKTEACPYLTKISFYL